jgi:hypothetical protein
VLDAEYHSRGTPRYFLSYEGLLQDWRHHVDRIARLTDAAWLDRSPRAENAIEEFLTSELYHERASPEESKNHGEVSDLARHTFRVLLEISARGENEELLGLLDVARAEFDEHCRNVAATVTAEDVTAESLVR